jgi:hypothetical protein
MKKIEEGNVVFEDLNNAKFQKLTKKESSVICGGNTFMPVFDVSTIVWELDSDNLCYCRPNCGDTRDKGSKGTSPTTGAKYKDVLHQIYDCDKKDWITIDKEFV